MACYEKVTGTCHSERSEESEVGHAARLVRPDASLPLSMTREGAFFTACRLLAPSAGLPDSSYTTRHRRPPARGGPTLDGRLVPLHKRSSLVGPPLAGGLHCRPVTGSQQTACHVRDGLLSQNPLLKQLDNAFNLRPPSW